MKPTKTTPASTLGEQLTMASTRRGLRRTVVGAVNLNNCGHRHPVSPAIRGPHRHAGRVWRSPSRRAVACPVAKTRPLKCPGSGHHTGDRESVLAVVDVGSEPSGNAEREPPDQGGGHARLSRFSHELSIAPKQLEETQALLDDLSVLA